MKDLLFSLKLRKYEAEPHPILKISNNTVEDISNSTSINLASKCKRGFVYTISLNPLYGRNEIKIAVSQSSNPILLNNKNIFRLKSLTKCEAEEELLEVNTFMKNIRRLENALETTYSSYWFQEKQ